MVSMLNRLLPDSRTDPELAPFRSGLLFGFFNTLTWQIALGTPLVLFAEQLGATTFQAGLAYSFVFLLTPVQVLATVLLPRFGYKGLTLGGWGLRSYLLLIPLVLAPWAAMRGAQPWMITALIGSCFGFCLLRAVGMAASLPWFFAILPASARGRYFANDYLLSGVASVFTLLACAGLFSLLPIYTALFLQYLISLIGSVGAYASLRKLPDGPVPDPISLRSVAADLPGYLRRPSTFRSYLAVTVVCYFCTTPLAPFTAYHLKATVGLAPGLIMLFEVMRYAGGVLGAAALRRRVDTLGARPFLLSALGAYVVLGFYWLGYVRVNWGGSLGLVAAYFLFGAANACWMVGNLNYLPKITTAENRTITVTLQGALASMAGGISVTAWGFILRSVPDDMQAGVPATDPIALQAMFGVVVAGSACLSWWLSRLPAEPNADGAEPLMIGNALLRPHRALGYLVNVIDPRTGSKTRE